MASSRGGYEPGSYVPLARIDSHTVPTALGAPEEMTDARGTLVWQARYAVWGNTVAEHWHHEHRPAPSGFSAQSPLPQNLRMQGQYADAETGLCYNTLRYYDPDIGRFISQDPIGLAGGINLYQHAPNPLTWVNPWGGLDHILTTWPTQQSTNLIFQQITLVLYSGP